MSAAFFIQRLQTFLFYPRFLTFFLIFISTFITSMVCVWGEGVCIVHVCMQQRVLLCSILNISQLNW